MSLASAPPLSGLTATLWVDAGRCFAACSGAAVAKLAQPPNNAATVAAAMQDLTDLTADRLFDYLPLIAFFH